MHRYRINNTKKPTTDNSAKVPPNYFEMSFLNGRQMGSHKENDSGSDVFGAANLHGFISRNKSDLMAAVLYPTTKILYVMAENLRPMRRS